MSFQHSFGCNCCSCTILSATFDSFYFVNVLPATSDQFFVTPGGAGSRFAAINRDHLGAGLIFMQTSTHVWTRGGGQTLFPELLEHPDFDAILAMADWPLGSRYAYQLVNQADAATNGYYFITANSFNPLGYDGPVGPTPGVPAGSVLVDWPNHWARQFERLDASGDSIDEPVDRLPFVALEGETYRSIKSMPPNHFAINLHRIVLPGWQNTADNSMRISLVADDDSVPISIRLWYRPQVPSGGRMMVDVIINGASPKTYRSSFLSGSNAANSFYGLWLLVRDGGFDLARQLSGLDPLATENPNFQAVSEFLDEDGDKQSYASRSFSLAGPLPPTRLQLSIEGSPAKLGQVIVQRLSSPRVTVYPLTEENAEARPGAVDQSLSCPDLRTCSVVYPWQHIDWRIKSFEIEGATAPRFDADSANVQCQKLLRPMANLTLPSIPQVEFEDPMYAFVAGFYFLDTTRILRSFSAEDVTFPAFFGDRPGRLWQRGFFNVGSSGLYLEVFDHSETHNRVRVKAAISYEGSRFPSYETTYTESVAIQPVRIGSNSTTTPTPFAGLTFATEFEVIDFFSGHPDPTNPMYLRWSGDLIDHVLTQFYMVWDNILVPKWEGNAIPEFTVSGESYDFTGSQPRYIRLRKRFHPTFVSSTGPDRGIFEIEGENHTIDLSTLRITIGGPS